MAACNKIYQKFTIPALLSQGIYTMLNCAIHLSAFFSLMTLTQNAEFIKKGFLWLPSLLAPNYELGFGLTWLFVQAAQVGSRVDMMLPSRFRYLILPWLMGWHINNLKDPESKKAKEAKRKFRFGGLNMSAEWQLGEFLWACCFPSAIQLYWLCCRAITFMFSYNELF